MLAANIKRFLIDTLSACCGVSEQNKSIIPFWGSKITRYTRENSSATACCAELQLSDFHSWSSDQGLCILHKDNIYNYTRRAIPIGKNEKT